MTYSEAAELQAMADKDISSLTHKQCMELDAFIREFAFDKFEKKLKTCFINNNKTGEETKAIRSFLRTCVRAHIGSLETDDMLTALDCYPKFLGEEQ